MVARIFFRKLNANKVKKNEKTLSQLVRGVSGACQGLVSGMSGACQGEVREIQLNDGKAPDE